MLSLDRIWSKVQDLEELIFLALRRSGGGGGGGGSLLYQTLPSGGTLAIPGGVNTFVAVDGSGGPGVQCTLDLPANGTATDGQIVVISIVSSTPGANPVIPNLSINPGSGNQIIAINNAGQILASGTSQTAAAQGLVFGFRYRLAVVTPATAPIWLQAQ